MEDFNGKIVVITGGASGIGRSFAQRFGAEGATVVIADIQQDNLRDVEKELTAKGIEAASMVCDVSDYDQVEKLADFVWSKYGRADVILNGAGIGGNRLKLLDEERRDIDKVFATNYFGVWHGSRIFGRRFVDQGTSAAIYNIGSENSFFVLIPRMASYQASKHAVWAMTEALRYEVPEFIDVSLIIPGWVETPMTGATGGMKADRFTQIALEQLKQGKFYVVSHASNMEHVTSRYEEIKEAYAKFAPRYEGDDEYDVVSLIRRARQDRQK